MTFCSDVDALDDACFEFGDEEGADVGAEPEGRGNDEDGCGVVLFRAFSVCLKGEGMEAGMEGPSTKVSFGDVAAPGEDTTTALEDDKGVGLSL